MLLFLYSSYSIPPSILLYVQTPFSKASENRNFIFQKSNIPLKHTFFPHTTKDKTISHLISINKAYNYEAQTLSFK